MYVIVLAMGRKWKVNSQTLMTTRAALPKTLDPNASQYHETTLFNRQITTTMALPLALPLLVSHYEWNIDCSEKRDCFPPYVYTKYLLPPHVYTTYLFSSILCVRETPPSEYFLTGLR